MTVPSGGARSRRSGRRPGWLLVTALLVLAILASSTLVFTNRVDLLRLAVILSLWAAVVAAFVSVSYRRQSELDQARARDMKFVYDLQLDREVSARREYELAVEAHLRRQLARELRAQAADEMSALRAELAALRSNLEAMLGADLGEQPALGSERVAMAMPAPPGRVESSRITAVTVEDDTLVAEETDTAALESPIIDVPEEPLAAPPVPPQGPHPPDYRGSHRRSAGTVAAGPVFADPPAPAEPAVMKDVLPPPPPPPPPQQPPPPPAPQQPEAPWRPPEVRRGRHWSADGGKASQGSDTSTGAAPGRHWVPGDQSVAANPAAQQRPAEDPLAPENSSGRPAPEESEGQHTGGFSVADLMSRLQVDGPVGGGGRRRRED
jgi:hypothetical protein